MQPPEKTDEQLVELVRDHDKELYSEIIRRYEKKISNYLRKFIQHPDELEDVLQSVFIKTYRNLNGFDMTKRFSPWIYRIAHNEALNHIKKNARVSVLPEEAELLIVDEKIDLPAEVDRSIARSIIEEALADLKPTYRETLILYFFEQKSYEEISDILRIPTSTVGTLLLRGKQLLKRHLEKTYAK